MMIHVQNGLEIPGADFEDRMLSGLRMDGAVLILNTVGVWLVKLNFLVFFHRLGHQIKSYLIFWWIALVVVVGCGAVLLGVIPYKCSFGSFSTIVLECSTNSYLNHIYTMYKASISIDVVSDAISESKKTPSCDSLFGSRFLIELTLWRRSHLFSCDHCLEDQNETPPEAPAHQRLPSRGFQHCCHRCARQCLRRRVQGGARKRSPSPGYIVVSILVLYGVYDVYVLQ